MLAAVFNPVGKNCRHLASWDAWHRSQIAAANAKDALNTHIVP